MKLVYVVVLSTVSFFFMLLLTKLMGKRQVAQLSMFDYIVSITVGSIAAELATELEEPLKPLVAMAVYSLLAVMLALISNKSHRVRHWVEGKPVVLYDNGKLYKENFKKSKMDIDEFLMQCRINGYFLLEDLQTALLEPNGSISFLPVSAQRPATPSDLSLSPKQNHVVVTVVSDGEIMRSGLKKSGKDEQWLKKQLDEQQTKLSDVFLATCDTSGKLTAFPMKKPEQK